MKIDRSNFYAIEKRKIRPKSPIFLKIWTFLALVQLKFSER